MSIVLDRTDLLGNPIPDPLTSEEETYRRKVRASCLGSIRATRVRQAKKKKPVVVDITPKQMVGLLEQQGYRCALTRQRFWQDQADRFGPSMPSMDRIDHDGPYTLGNVRIILIGVNSLRGRGSDADMYRNARALVVNER
jgi:hypothetical protein